MKIYTQVTTKEEWTLETEDIKSFCNYMRNEELPLKSKTDLEILKIIESDPDKYNDHMRTWLYDNLEQPYKEWVGEEGAEISFKEKDLNEDIYIDEGHEEGIKEYTESEAINVIKEIIKEDKDIVNGAEDKLSDENIIELGAKWYSIYKK